MLLYPIFKTLFHNYYVYQWPSTTSTTFEINALATPQYESQDGDSAASWGHAKGESFICAVDVERLMTHDKCWQKFRQPPHTKLARHFLRVHHLQIGI